MTRDDSFHDYVLTVDQVKESEEVKSKIVERAVRQRLASASIY